MLGLHALLLVGALQLGVWRDREPARGELAPRVVWVSASLPTAPATPRRAVPPAPAPAQAQAQAVRTPTVPAMPAAPTTHATPAMSTPEPLAITAPAAPAPSENTEAPPTARPPPLNLALPGRSQGASAPWHSQRNPALDDPRSNSPKPTLESRIAAALGGNDQITEYRLEDGSVRLKRGNSCVVVRPNRASALDPFNGSAQTRPRLLDRC